MFSSAVFATSFLASAVSASAQGARDCELAWRRKLSTRRRELLQS